MTTCCSWVGWGPQGNSGGQGGGGYVRYDTASVDNPSAASVRTSPQLGTLTYWANDMAASNTVSGVTNSWTLDPATRQHTETFGATGVTTTNHYADGGDSPAWTSSSDASWSRNIPGIDGQLAAINDNTGRSELQLTNLHGDVVATAPNSSTATGVDSYSESTEFGAPCNGTSAKYGWLGGHQRATDTLDGLTLMGQRLYNPLSGRFLQTDPVPGGSANDYDYANQDPVNSFDLSGQIADDAAKDVGSAGCDSACQYASGHWNDRPKKHHHHHWGSWLRKAAEIGAGVAVFAVACGATAGIGCAVAVGVGLGAADGAINYSIDNRRKFRWSGLAKASAVGGAEGGLTAYGIGHLTGGRAFGWGGVGKRIFKYTFRIPHEW